MKESYGEGLAPRTGPESCTFSRKAAGEALTGVCMGQPLSGEIQEARDADAVNRSGRQHRRRRYARAVSGSCAVEDPVHVQKLLAREPGDPTSDPGRWRRGPRCESPGSTTAMNKRGKSDRPICTAEAAEQRQVRFLPAEAVEGRGLTKGNSFRQNKFWTQSQERIRHDG